ncbi:MAG: NUDIX domain-containing protein [Rhodospirillum sp.]|nr:NUDIX domain-containing protein [Rhodospirillum sp.]MCF8489063.1 NUDIX domain-containing protein [Rhodospirillum sp.]MCF8501234.1 NUDIX domain-containing protein [Rhodospirillum sp.]
MTKDSFHPSQVTVTERKRVANGYIKVDQIRLRHEQYAGGMGPEIQREVINRGNAAAILLYDAPRDRVVLIEQFRPAAWDTGMDNPWLLEIVAGIIDAGEDAETVARRESVEECGLAPSEVIRFAHTLVSPGVMTESVTFFCGRVDSEGAGGIHGLPEEGEDIRVVVLDADRFLAMVRDGTITNGTCLIAAQWFTLNRTELRIKWA